VGKVDGLAKASIFDINGLTLSAAAFTGLLDTYTGALNAFSLRRLATASTVLIRVRGETAGGTGDDDEADVTFDTGDQVTLDSTISNASAGVTATTLGEFLNVGTVGGTTYSNPDSLTVTAECYVDTMYDQAGSNDAIENTFGLQPLLHDGTANTDLIQNNSGKTAIQNVSNSGFTNGGLNSGGSTTWTVVSVFEDVTRASGGFTACLYGANSRIQANQSDSEIILRISSNQFVTGQDNQVNSVIWQLDGTTGTSTYAVNGSTTATASIGTSSWSSTIGRANSSDMVEYFNEGIVWDSELDDFSGVYSNINNFFLLSQPTDAPTSGLLATYTGAAAAYSVRQLSNKAIIAMRIRRDSDDEERNIGFDSNGDLDTTAISAFCGTANGYVTRWWDQSTNGNHADQPVGGTGSNTNQPQIYNGTAVITENGKPALTFDGIDDYLSVSSSQSTFNFVHNGNDSTLFSVNRFGDNANPNATYVICDNGGLSTSNVGFGVAFDDNPKTDGIRTIISRGVGAQPASEASTNSVFTPNQQTLLYWFADADNATAANRNKFAADGGTLLGSNPNTYTPSTAAASFDLNLGRYGGGALYLLGTFQELVLFDANHSSVRTDIETNIDNYFQIPGM
jgi:hypothetical protein